MRNYLIWGFLFATVLLLAVANSAPGNGKLKDRQWAEARNLYLSRCTSCHRLYDPRNYSDDEWKLWMAKMSRKAKLDPNQKELLYRYLEDYRAVTTAK